MPANPTLTAAPVVLDPVVVPTPRFFWQYADPLGSKGLAVPAGTPLRPARMKGLSADAAAPLTNPDDRWQSSGCHPIALTLIADWIASQAELAKGLGVTGMTPPLPPDENRLPLSWARWIFDPSATLGSKAYTSEAEHPPWVPRTPDAKHDTQWLIDHASLRKAMARLARGGAPLACHLVAPAKGRNLRDDLASAIYAYGPLALNISIPGHFVLLYGIRDDYFYIFDPGQCIYSTWAVNHPQCPPKSKGLDQFTLGASAENPDQYALRFFPGSSRCHLAINATVAFPLPKRDKPVRFLDQILVAEGYGFAGLPPFPEFLTAAAPDGRAPRPGGSAPPAASTPGAGASPPAAATPAPAMPVPAAPPPSVPPAGSTLNDWYGGFLNWIDSVVPSSGAASPPPLPAAPAPAPSTATAVLAVKVVRADDGSSVGGAKVTLSPTGKVTQGTTTKTGWTSPPLPTGRYQLEVDAPNAGLYLGDEVPTSAGPVTLHVDLAPGGSNVTVKVTSLKDARAFVYVLEYPGRRRLAGAKVEVVGITEQAADADGEVVTRRFAPKKYTVYGKLPGYGPVPAEGQAPWEGWSTEDRTFEAGDTVFAVTLARLARVIPAAPPGKIRNPPAMKVDATIREIFHDAVEHNPIPFTFSHSHVDREFKGTWTLYDPSGVVLDTNEEVFGIGDYQLDSAVLTKAAAASDTAFGWWTLRLEDGDYFDDYAFAYVAPLPRALTDRGPVKPPKLVLPQVTSSDLFVNGEHFVDWFNGTLRPKYAGAAGKSPTLLADKKTKRAAELLPAPLSKKNFISVFDDCKSLWAEKLTFHQFLGFLLIFYNETGGTLAPALEKGSLQYLFEPNSDTGKASYNKAPNRLAGDQLRDRAVLTDPAAIEAWNSSTTFPSDASEEVLAAAVECDFHKYRGRGLVQLTWQDDYERQVAPLLAAGNYPPMDDLSDASLSEIVQADYRISVPMVGGYLKSIAKAVHGLDDDPPNWAAFGKRVSGGANYGKIFEWRCATLLHELEGLAVEMKAGS